MTNLRQDLGEKKEYKKTDKKDKSSRKGGESKVDSSAKKRKAAEKVISDLAKERERETNNKGKSEYTKYLQQQLDFKKQKYEDQKKRQLEKIKEKGKSEEEKQKAKAKQALSGVKVNRISSQDKDATAHAKAIEGIGSLAVGLGKAAYHGLKSKKAKADRKKAERDAAAKQADKKEPGTPGRPKGEDKPKTEKKPAEVKGALPGTKIKGLLSPESRQKSMRRRLPPSSEGGSRIGQPAPGSRAQLPGSMKKRMVRAAVDGAKRISQPGPDRIGKPAAEKPALKPSVDKRRLLKPSSEGGSRVGQPAAGSRTELTVGQKARQNPALRAKLTKERGGSVDYPKAKRKVLGLEDYSDWRNDLEIYEEFLSEIEKKKEPKEKVIDIMKGKNKVTINPLEEGHAKVASGEMKDREGYMANSQLDQMERAIAALRKKVKNADDQLPAWVQSKITKAADYIDTASDYMQSDVKEELNSLLAQKLDENLLDRLGQKARTFFQGNDPTKSRYVPPDIRRAQQYRDAGGKGVPPANWKPGSSINPTPTPTKPEPETGGGLTDAQKEQKLKQQRAETDAAMKGDSRAPRPAAPRPAAPRPNPTVLAKKGGVEGRLDKSTGKFTAGNFSASEKDRYNRVSTANKDAATNAKYQQLRKTDPAKAAEFGMKANQAKYGKDFAKPKTPNPMMKDMPGRNKAELETLRGNAAINSIAKSPNANRILSGNAMSSTANRIGQQSLNRSEFGSATKPAPTPAPGSVPKPPAPKVATPAPGSVPNPPKPPQKINSSVEYPEMLSILEQIQGGLWEAKKSEMKCNKPRAEAHGSGETGKSHVVKACSDGKEKLIRFGQLGVKGSPKKEGESEEYANRRKRFKTRHAKNIAKGKLSAAYWSNKVKW